MKRTPKDMAPGAIHSTHNYGNFKIVKYVNCRNINVRFLNTGYETKTRADIIRSGTVRDKLSPSAFGVGFIGEGRYSSRDGKAFSKAYSTWKGMLGRCYDENSRASRPTYAECTVCEEWHNFQNFAEWFESNYIEGFDLDKDIRVNGNKVYGPDTCMFASREENNIESHARYWRFKSPSGEVVDIYNLSEFCRIECLDAGAMWRVSKGIDQQHKGWRV